MTTETVTDFRVEKIEEEKNVTWCDVCNQKVEDDEPSTEVVARPEVKRNKVDFPSELERYRNPRMEMGPGAHKHNISPTKMEYIISGFESAVKEANRNSTIKAITIHEDVCGSCFEEMADEELGDVPDLTVEDVELERIDDFHEKAKNVAKYPKWCSSITFTMTLIAFVISAILGLEGRFLFSGGVFVLFLLFFISTLKLNSWANAIKHSYSP